MFGMSIWLGVFSFGEVAYARVITIGTPVSRNVLGLYKCAMRLWKSRH